jgi:hypothetical protein
MFSLNLSVFRRGKNAVVPINSRCAAASEAVELIKNEALLSDCLNATKFRDFLSEDFCETDPVSLQFITQAISDSVYLSLEVPDVSQLYKNFIFDTNTLTEKELLQVIPLYKDTLREAKYIMNQTTAILVFLGEHNKILVTNPIVYEGLKRIADKVTAESEVAENLKVALRFQKRIIIIKLKIIDHNNTV